MNRLFYFFFLMILFASCVATELDGIEPGPNVDMVDVSFEVLSGESKARLYYEQNATQFFPKWNTGDLVTVVTQNRRAGAPFMMTNNGEETFLGGKIQYWNDTTTLYAIYPHRDDYYEFDGRSFLYKAEGQVVNVEGSNDNSYESNSNALDNVILMASTAGVGFDDGGVLSTGSMSFKQAMSFLRFTLVAPGELHKLKRVTLRDTENTFVTEAKIRMDKDGEIHYDYLKYSDKLTATIKSQDESNRATVNFALLPTTTKNPVLEIEAIDENGVEYIFTRSLLSNLVFTLTALSPFFLTSSIISVTIEVIFLSVSVFLSSSFLKKSISSTPFAYIFFIIRHLKYFLQFVLQGFQFHFVLVLS